MGAARVAPRSTEPLGAELGLGHPLRLWAGAGLRLRLGFGLILPGFGLIWLDFGFWLSFTRILIGFDLDLAGFVLDFGWIWLGF